jgi:hypothetical protein
MQDLSHKVQLLNTREAAKSRELIARENVLSRKEREEEKALEKLKERQKLNPKQGDVLTALDNAESELQNIVDMLGDNDSWVGPLDEMVPGPLLFGDEQSAFRTATGKIEDVYRHAITGAGAGPRELSTLRTRVPNIGDRPGQFKAKAKEAIADIRRKRAIQLKNLKKQGKDVSPYEAAPMEASQLTTPNEVERTIKSGPDKGRIAIFDAETQQFLRFK